MEKKAGNNLATELQENDIVAKSWAHLNELLYVGNSNKDTNRFRSNFAFRGLSNKKFDLSTSLMRLGGDYKIQEQRLLRDFKKYTNFQGSDWELLAIAQHHGLPTRLLDWTYSPYVALHFATAEVSQTNTDGVIWCIDYIKANELIHDDLKNILLIMEADAFTVEMLDKAAGSLEDFNKKFGTQKFVICFEPPSLDDRIVNQFGLFSMTSQANLKLDSLLIQHPELYHRIIIPAHLNWEVRDKLDQANITERVLFSGLDGLSQWLKRRYSPRELKMTGGKTFEAIDDAIKEIDIKLAELKLQPEKISFGAIVKVVELAIERGVPIYNHGSPQGCAQVYLYAARRLLAIMIAHPTRNLDPIKEMLNRAVSDEGADSLAWGLRRVFDSILQQFSHECK